jgi:hypothetical protein
MDLTATDMSNQATVAETFILFTEMDGGPKT